MIDLRLLDLRLIDAPEVPWSSRARYCSIRFTMAVWAARTGYRYEGRWTIR